ncbi:MAG TPA: TauD/TfdA family dioxygenase [Parvibaculum sp.]|uniref:TauD/TfdA dioxygenase family protein n=1 Tax=Parvibaculum sp. TaxID=2024848 RepID=UPI002C10F522|nr:TauD/TfdA family dioxygenase [Parvibaculum sp.]HMM13010.1 TauD/TfdA family dioxygenase [Parvibaculum sp.]
MSFQTPTVRKLSAGCGAEVLGVDLRKPSNSDMEIIRDAYRDYGVIFFRDQQLTPEDHIAFARRWGEIDINKFFPANGEYPEIAEVGKEKEKKTNIGGGWHRDLSYDPSPAMGSILVARVLPKEGGDTLFSNMYAAYEALSDGLKETLSSLKAVHSNAMAFGAAGFYKNSDQSAGFKGENLIGQAVHPVIITHPLSGRKALYVNPAFTTHFEGWTPLESRPLLDFLYAHAVRPEFTCRFQWREGSVAFWDNRATWHYAANDYHGSRRLLHRITIGGVPLG